MASLGEDYIGLDLSASEVKALTGWPDTIVNDYTSVLNSLRALASSIQVMSSGAIDPNGAVISNNSRQYFNTSTGKLWINPVVGASTGWVVI